MKGGKRPGAGRPKGSANKRTQATAKRVAAKIEKGKALDPIDALIEVMTDAMKDYRAVRTLATAGGDLPAPMVAILGELRGQVADYAAKAAPYLHARLAALTATPPGHAPAKIVIAWES